MTPNVCLVEINLNQRTADEKKIKLRSFRRCSSQ